MVVALRLVCSNAILLQSRRGVMHSPPSSAAGKQMQLSYVGQMFAVDLLQSLFFAAIIDVDERCVCNVRRRAPPKPCEPRTPRAVKPHGSRQASLRPVRRMYEYELGCLWCFADE